MIIIPEKQEGEKRNGEGYEELEKFLRSLLGQLFEGLFELLLRHALLLFFVFSDRQRGRVKGGAAGDWPGESARGARER